MKSTSTFETHIKKIEEKCMTKVDYTLSREEFMECNKLFDGEYEIKCCNINTTGIKQVKHVYWNDRGDLSKGQFHRLEDRVFATLTNMGKIFITVYNLQEIDCQISYHHKKIHEGKINKAIKFIYLAQNLNRPVDKYIFDSVMPINTSHGPFDIGMWPAKRESYGNIYNGLDDIMWIIERGIKREEEKEMLKKRIEELEGKIRELEREKSMRVFEF